MFGGAKINEIFEYDFQKSLVDVNIIERTKDSDLYWTIKNQTALRQTMYFNNEVFEEYSAKHVEELKNPCLMCLSRVQDEMRQIVQGRRDETSSLQTRSSNSSSRFESKCKRPWTTSCRCTTRRRRPW